MNLTTKPLRPAMTSPTNAWSQNTDASQDCSCTSKNLTKWRISAHEGFRKPHELSGRQKEGKKRNKRGSKRKRKAIVGRQGRYPLTARLSSDSWPGCPPRCQCRRTDQGHFYLYICIDTDTHAGSVYSETLVCPSPLWIHLSEKEEGVYYFSKCELHCSYFVS